MEDIADNASSLPHEMVEFSVRLASWPYQVNLRKLIASGLWKQNQIFYWQGVSGLCNLVYYPSFLQVNLDWNLLLVKRIPYD